MANPLSLVAIAVAFLTRLPIKTGEVSTGELGASTVFFPLAGSIVGMLVALSDVTVRHLFALAAVVGPDRASGQLTAPLVGALAAVAANLVVTGGLHLDGVADTADGLASGQDKKRILEVMKDSRVGAAGAMWLALAFLCRFILVAAMPYHRRYACLMLAPVAGRLAQVLAISRFRYAREAGTGKAFSQSVRPVHVAGAIAVALVITVAAGAWLAGEPALLLRQGAAPQQGAGQAFREIAVLGLMLAASAGSSMLAAAGISRRIGGLTGDTYGAISEVGEITLLFLGVLLP